MSPIWQVPNSCMVMEADEADEAHEGGGRRLAELAEGGWRPAGYADERRLQESSRRLEAAGIKPAVQDEEYWRDMQVAALVHDVGKLLSVFGEARAYAPLLAFIRGRPLLSHIRSTHDVGAALRPRRGRDHSPHLSNRERPPPNC